MTIYKNMLGEACIEDWQIYYDSANPTPEDKWVRIIDQKPVHEVLDYYADYILDRSKCMKIFDKVDSMKYYNLGYDPVKKSNNHLFVLNDKHDFKYFTGCGINCEESKDRIYNYTKLFFDMATCIIREAGFVQDRDEGDFLEEFGYFDGTRKSYDEGRIAYAGIKQNEKKAREIWGNDIIANIYEICDL